MEGFAAVQSRIAAIESRFATQPPPTTAETAAPSRPAGAALVPAGGAGFEQAYSSALAASAPTTPAPRLQPGQYGRLEPPAELRPFGNGRVPPSAMVAIGHGDHRLHAPAARAFQQMEAAARADGITFGVITSYRDFQTQHRLAQEKGLYSEGGLAAEPGTSNHGWGLSIDLDLDPRAQEWMREHGWRFGFVEDVAREPWHWTYRPA